MDENVIFNNSGGNDPNNSDNSSTENPAAPQQPAAVPEAANPVDTTSEPVPSTGASQQVQVNASGQSSEGVATTGEAPQLEPGTDQGVPEGPPPRTGRSLWVKIIIGLVVVVLLVLGIFLFASRGESNKEVKLVWWGLWEDQRVMKPVIEGFQKEHPNITVEYVKQDPKQYREKLLTRIKNGTGPDIFRYHNTWVPMIAESLLPLPTDVITPNEFKKTFYPVMQKDVTFNGGIYGIPLGADTLGLFVNTELLEAAGVEPPKTWDDFVKAARTLTVKNEGKIQTAGAALGTYGNVTHAPDIISLLFIQQGVDIKTIPSAELKKKTDVLEFYSAFAEGEQNVWDATLDESLLSFARGNLAMYIGFSWDIFRIQAINNNLSFKTYPVPQLVGRNSALASYWVEGVSAETPNKREALLFMQYLTKKETAQKLYAEASKTRAFGAPYARRDLADSLKSNELLYPFVSQLPNASSSYFASDTNDGEGGINALSNTYLGNAVNGIVNDNSSAQTVVETLDKGMDQVFQKYGIK